MWSRSTEAEEWCLTKNMTHYMSSNSFIRLQPLMPCKYNIMNAAEHQQSTPNEIRVKGFASFVTEGRATSNFSITRLFESRCKQYCNRVQLLLCCVENLTRYFAKYGKVSCGRILSNGGPRIGYASPTLLTCCSFQLYGRQRSSSTCHARHVCILVSGL